MNVQKFNKLLSKVKSDPTALTTLHNYYFEKIVFDLISYGKYFAEDVAQEFFMKLLKRPDDKKEHVEFPNAWVYKSCHNIAITKIKVENKFVEVKDNEIEYEQKEYEDVYGIGDLLKTLDIRAREIISLKYWKGYTNKEISYIINETESNVRQILRRSLIKLRNLL